MCQTLGIRQAAQTEILMGWHNLQDRKYSELRPAKRVRRAVDKLLLRRAYDKARQENPALERLFAQEREQAAVSYTHLDVYKRQAGHTAMSPSSSTL